MIRQGWKVVAPLPWNDKKSCSKILVWKHIFLWEISLAWTEKVQSCNHGNVMHCEMSLSKSSSLPAWLAAHCRLSFGRPCGSCTPAAVASCGCAVAADAATASRVPVPGSYAAARPAATDPAAVPAVHSAACSSTGEILHSYITSRTALTCF